MKETVLNCIKILKRYCKVTLNVFFIKTFFGDDKKMLLYMIDFLWQIEFLLMNMLKLLKAPSFLFKISQITGFSCFFLWLNCQI